VASHIAMEVRNRRDIFNSDHRRSPTTANSRRFLRES
jgi:hypothetical protein